MKSFSLVLILLSFYFSLEDTPKILTKNALNNYLKGESDTFKIRISDLDIFNIILRCNKENTMKIVYEDEEDKFQEFHNFYLINNPNYEYTIYLSNKNDNYTFEAVYLSKLINVTYVNSNFSLEFTKFYSPMDYVILLVEYKNYNKNSPAILHYEQYVGDLGVKYIPGTDDLIVKNILKTDKLTGAKTVNNFIQVNHKYFIVKIKTNSAYDFKIQLYDYFFPTNSLDDIDPLKQYYYLINPKIQFQIRFSNDLFVKSVVLYKILAYQNNNFKLVVKTKNDITNVTLNNRGIFIYKNDYENFEISCENGYILFSAVGIPYAKSRLVKKNEDASGLLDKKLLVLQTPDNNYDILFSRLRIKSSDKYTVEECNLYRVGGGLNVNDFCYMNGPIYRMANAWNLYKDYYFPNANLYKNTQKFSDEFYYFGAYYYCYKDWYYEYDTFFSYEFNHYYWKDIAILEKNKAFILSLNADEYNRIESLKEFYRILIPDDAKKLRFIISNLDENNFLNFHISKSINESLNSFMTIRGEYSNIVNIPENTIDENSEYISKKRYFYLYFENARTLSFEYDFVSFNDNYKINYTKLEKNINITQKSPDDSTIDISFNPYLFNEKVDYEILVFNDTIKDNIKTKIQLDLCLMKYEYKSVSLGEIIIKEPSNKPIEKTFKFPYTYSNFFTIVLIGKQVDNFKYKQIYNKIYFKYKYKGKNK